MKYEVLPSKWRVTQDWCFLFLLTAVSGSEGPVGCVERLTGVNTGQQRARDRFKSNLNKAGVIILWYRVRDEVSDSVNDCKTNRVTRIFDCCIASAFSCWDTRQQRCRHKPSAVCVCVHPADVSDNELALPLQPWLVVLCWLPIRHSTAPAGRQRLRSRSEPPRERLRIGWAVNMHQNEPRPWNRRSTTSYCLWAHGGAASLRWPCLRDVMEINCVLAVLPPMNPCNLGMRRMGRACRMRLIRGHYHANDFTAQ